MVIYRAPALTKKKKKAKTWRWGSWEHIRRPHSDCLSLHSSQAVALRFVAVGPRVVKCLNLGSRGVLVAGCFFPNQVSAVVEEVRRQQETRKRQDEQAEVDLKHETGRTLKHLAAACQTEIYDRKIRLCHQ